MDVSNSEDVIDSRDVIARIEELEAELDEFVPADDAVIDEMVDERQELRVLKALAEECEGYAADWLYGETLIRDSYFTEYAEELAYECAPSQEAAAFLRGNPGGELSGWPFTCMSIDWEQAARELQMDYTAVDFDGVTYWIR